MPQSQLLSRLQANLRQPFAGPRGRALQRVFNRTAQRYWRSQRGPRGAWKPLAESTIARKGSSTILVDTGRLRDSLTERRGGDVIYQARGNRLILGTEVPYAAAVDEDRPFLPEIDREAGRVFLRELVR